MSTLYGLESEKAREQQVVIQPATMKGGARAGDEKKKHRENAA